MSTGPQVRESLAPICRMHPATVERYFAELMAAGILPKSGRGGGKSAVHFDSLHLAYSILSFGAPTPGGAVDAVRKLAGLFPESAQPGDASLRTILAGEIETRARYILQGQADKISEDPHKWELTLCLDPVMVWMTWMVEGAEKRRKYLESPQLNLPSMKHPQDANRGIRRLTIITVDVLNAAAWLYADTLARQQNLPIPTAPAAETENAALAGAAPIQDRNSIPATSKREHRGEREIPQALSSRGPGHFHHQTRSPADVEPSPPHCLVA
jgi:hypothetical protein